MGSSIGGIVGSFSGAVTSWKMGAEQKKIAYRMADYEETRRQQQEVKQIETLRSAKSTQRAAYGASGVRREGSPIEVELETQRLGERAIEESNYWSRVKQYEVKKAGRLAKKAGQMEAWGQVGQGVGSIVGMILSMVGGM